jgi:hypothetical protein
LPVLFLSSAVAAQESRVPSSRMPESFTPPAGLCRLWISGVPASQQPAPTDCASAIRNRPSNAAVVFGPQLRGESMERRPFAGRAGQSPVRQLAPDARQPDARQPDARQPEAMQPGGRPVQVREEPRGRTPDRVPDTAVKPAKRKPEMPQ